MNDMKSLLRKQPVAFIPDFGKVPPQCVDVEESILGGIMIDADCMLEVAAILKSEDFFYKDAHQMIYKAIQSLYANEKKIDLLTVSQELKKIGNLDACGGYYALAQLTNKVGSTAHIVEWCLLVKEAWVKRSVISISSDALSEAYLDTTDCHELLDTAMLKIGAIHSDITGSQIKNWSNVVDDFDTDLHNYVEGEETIIGFTTGFKPLDTKLLGFQKKQLTLIAGRPGEGKSTIQLQAVRANLILGIPVGVFSLEMPAEEILVKLYAMEAGIDTINIQKKSLTADEWKRYYVAKKVVREWPLYIHDKSGTSIQTIKSVGTMWRLKHGVELIFVDYLQLATVGNDIKRVNNREQEIGYISRSLKALAMNADVAVVALSAMSRDIEGRVKKERRPNNSDLRDSGSLEQDANKIIFVFRPEEHGIDKYEDGTSTAGVTEFIVTKARLSAKGTVNAFFEAKYSRFANDNHREERHTLSPEGFGKINNETAPF